MNQRGRNTSTESPNFLLSRQRIQWGSSFSAGTVSLGSSVVGAEARHCGWSEVARSRRGGSQRGVQELGTVPYGLLLPSPPLSLSLSRVQMHIHLLWSLGLLLFPRCDLPLPVSLPHFSLPLSFLVSLFLLLSPSPRPVLLHLNPSSSLSFQLSVFWGFFCSVFFLKVQFHSHKEWKK